MSVVAPRVSEGSTQAGNVGDLKFGEMLKGALGKADGTQQGAVSAVQNLLAGKSDDLLSAVTAMSKADLSFKLLVGVRNKVIEAYKQTMNMQI
jgi:flagellar hook-basal body complex protein FliE